MDIGSIVGLIGSSSGIVALVLYFSTERESKNVKNLMTVVDGLRTERETLIGRVDRLETKVKYLEEKEIKQDSYLNVDQMAFNAVILCDRQECPIIKKRDQLKNKLK
jgi:hypothetical protein